MSAFAAAFDVRLAQQAIEQIGADSRDPSVLRAAGRAVSAELQAHFRALAAARHRSGVRFNFYLQAAKSVSQPQLAENGAVVTVSAEGVAQRRFGGRIGAVNAQWITIPATPEAYGRRAREFGNLRFVKFRDDLAALVAPERTGGGAFLATLKGSPGARKARAFRLGTKEDKRPPVIFWLKRSVTQKADPSVLPSDERLVEAATRGAESFIARRGGAA